MKRVVASWSTCSDDCSRIKGYSHVLGKSAERTHDKDITLQMKEFDVLLITFGYFCIRRHYTNNNDEELLNYLFLIQ